MTTPAPTASLETLKQQAKRLRTQLAADGHRVSHGQVLELLARQHGYKDWNTLHAAIGNRQPATPVAAGDRVSGRYLGQQFAAEVLGVEVLKPADRYRITLQFDEPVDVVTFDSFSAYRQRVSCTIDRTGQTAEKTSDGQPHVQLQL